MYCQCRDTVVCPKCFGRYELANLCSYKYIRDTVSRIRNLNHILLGQSHEFTENMSYDVKFTYLSTLIDRLLGYRVTCKPFDRSIQLIINDQPVSLRRITVREVKFLRFIFGDITLKMRDVQIDELYADNVFIENCQVKSIRTDFIKAVDCRIHELFCNTAELHSSTVHIIAVSKLDHQNCTITTGENMRIQTFRELKDIQLEKFVTFEPNVQTRKSISRGGIMHVPRIDVTISIPEQMRDLSRCHVELLILERENLNTAEIDYIISTIGSVGRLEIHSSEISDAFVNLATNEKLIRPWKMCTLNYKTVLPNGRRILPGNSGFINNATAQRRQTELSTSIGNDLIKDVKGIIYQYLAIH